MTTTTHNGTFPHDARAAAKAYLSRGLAPIPLPTRSKKPDYEGWQKPRVTASNIDECFPVDVEKNIGILNGAPSRTADVDLDCAEAVEVARLLLRMALA